RAHGQEFAGAPWGWGRGEWPEGGAELLQCDGRGVADLAVGGTECRESGARGVGDGDEFDERQIAVGQAVNRAGDGVFDDVVEGCRHCTDESVDVASRG